MIKLENINKYYAKGKKNELHVLKNVSLELPDTGLIAFLGRSGSGKTTLLNVIGGFDKATGNISYDEKVFTKYDKHLDDFRQKHISYIFQNYLLLPELSIWQNLVKALEVIGVRDNEEVEKRITYALKAVGMYKFRKKLAKALSGGQQQRVAIARALLKDAKVILADEPTGNLDRANSVEVMNILKKISETRLVLLVTHSNELAEFYADKIIYLKDGNITNDKQGDSSTTLNNENINTIYLKDLENQNLATEELKFNLYTDNKTKAQIRLITINNKVYIDADIPVQVIDKQVVIKDAHYEDLTKEMINSYDFSINWYSETKKEYPSFLINLKAAILKFFKKTRRNRFFNMCFVIMGALFAIATILFSLIFTPGRDFVYLEDKYILADYDWSDSTELYRTIDKAYEQGIISDLVSHDSNKMIYAISQKGLYDNNLVAIDYAFILMYQDEALETGQTPAIGEVVISKKLAKKLQKNLGLASYDEVIGQRLSLSVQTTMVCKVSGIAEQADNSIYLHYRDFNEIYTGTTMYGEYKPTPVRQSDLDYQIVEGRDIQNNLEILVPVGQNYALNENLSFGNETYEVVGFVDLEYNYNGLVIFHDNVAINEFINLENAVYRPASDINIVVGRYPTTRNECLVPLGYEGPVYENYQVVGYYLDDFLKERYSPIISYEALEYKIHFEGDSQIFSVNDLEALKELVGTKARVITMQDQNQENLKEDQLYNFLTKGIIMVVLIMATLIYIYFIMRSHVILATYDIGVLRSIGAAKKYIYRDYIAEILVITTFANLIGYIIVYLFYYGFGSLINTVAMQEFVVFSNLIMIIGGILLYPINLAIGLLPIRRYLRKTPAQITQMYDI